MKKNAKRGKRENENQDEERGIFFGRGGRCLRRRKEGAKKIDARTGRKADSRRRGKIFQTREVFLQKKKTRGRYHRTGGRHEKEKIIIPRGKRVGVLGSAVIAEGKKTMEGTMRNLDEERRSGGPEMWQGLQASY